MAAVQKGLAAAPMGKPRMAADMVGVLVPGAGGEMSVKALAPVALGAQAAVAVAYPASAPKAVKAAGVVRATRAGKQTTADARTDTPTPPVVTLRTNPD